MTTAVAMVEAEPLLYEKTQAVVSPGATEPATWKLTPAGVTPPWSVRVESAQLETSVALPVRVEPATRAA